MTPYWDAFTDEFGDLAGLHFEEVLEAFFYYTHGEKEKSEDILFKARTSVKNRNVTRRIVLDEDISNALDIIKENLKYRLHKQGPGAFSSPHETYGVLYEEVYELLDAMKNNDSTEFLKELSDIAVAAIFGIASITK